eukprot:scaffold19366_cov14-Tisochrysis_lutea.AAC.1
MFTDPPYSPCALHLFTQVTRPAGTSHKGQSPEQGHWQLEKDTEDLVQDMLQAADQSSIANGIK